MRQAAGVEQGGAAESAISEGQRWLRRHVRGRLKEGIMVVAVPAVTVDK